MDPHTENSTDIEDDHALVIQLDGLAGRLSSRLIRLSGRDIRNCFEQTLQEIGRILDADRSTFVEVSSATATIDTTHSWARSGIPPFKLSMDLHRLQHVLASFKSGEEVRTVGPGDLAPGDVGGKASGDLAQLVSSLIMPIDMAGRQTCALSVDSFRRHLAWPAPALAALRLIGEVLASAVYRCRQELELEGMSVELTGEGPPVEHEKAYLGKKAQRNDGVKQMCGESPAFADALTQLREVAPTDSTVLLLGETGTGKEIFARALHEASSRRSSPLIRVNCGALPATLIESELFGHDRGAFTGAVTTRQGRFELAHRGTIFLDEIGDLPLELQPRLLRVLQEGEFERVGSSQTRRVDVRVIAATHHNLETAVEEGAFRADLYYRLNVFPIALPSLRERRSDIPELVWFFIHLHGRALNRHIELVPTSAMESLQSYDWPGNVRELENIIERAMIRSTDETLILDEGLDGPTEPMSESGFSTDPSTTLEDLERRHMQETLRVCGWRINGPRNAAQRLGLHPNTLRFRMKKLGIMRPARAS